MRLGGREAGMPKANTKEIGDRLEAGRLGGWDAKGKYKGDR